MPFASPAWPSRPTRLFGFALGCALASCVALAAWAMGEDVGQPHRLPAALALAGTPPLPRGPQLDHVLDEVQASAMQRSQVHQILEAADADLRVGRDAALADREQMARLFAAPVVDASAVEAVRQRMEQRHDAESRRMLQAMVDVSQVLGAVQRQQIARQLADAPRRVAGVRPNLPATQQ